MIAPTHTRLSRFYRRLAAASACAVALMSLPLAGAAGEGANNPSFAHVDSIMLQAVADSVFPGAVLLVADSGRRVHLRAYGMMGYGTYARLMPKNAIFDLASVTKVVATTTAAMLLVDRGQLDLDAPVQRYLPGFTGENKDKVTVRHLLVHASGLPPFRRYYLENLSAEETLHRIMIEPLIYSPGSETRYSDLGIILTAKIVEAISGLSLDRFCTKNIFQPLDMKDTFFNPPAEVLDRIPPTEYDPWRGRMVHGQVHDENAFTLGGVSGHAGLFSTAEDLSHFAAMLLAEGKYGGRQLISPEIIAEFTRRQNLVSGSSRALGWDTRSAEKSSSGQYMSMRAFGHTGFTGTSIWIDPVKKVFVILLSNRVHPTRDNRRIIGFRPRLHDAVMQALGKSR